MIKSETVIINGIEYRRTYSDSGFMIHKYNKKDQLYIEAVDILGSTTKYYESSVLVVSIEPLVE